MAKGFGATGCARMLGTMAVALGFAFVVWADVSPQDLQIETVDGINWSFVTNGGKAKVTNKRMHTAIDASTTGAVVVPDTLGGCPVTAIGAYAFFQMPGITSLTIPEGVEEIEYYACRGCTNLETVSLPSTLRSIGNAVFFNCQSLKVGHIPDSVTSMGSETFSGCRSMTSVKFSANVNSLGTMTCYNCSNLTNVTIPDCVRDIGISAFLNCGKLKSASIPNSVTNIGNFAFNKCTSLETLELPDGLTAINQSFMECSSLKSVRISANVATIAPNAFFQCSSLTSFEVDPANTAFKSVDGTICDITGAELVAWPYGLSPIVIPPGVKRIGNGAFAYRPDITSFVFPEGLVTIGASAFQACSHLGTVTFPSSLKTIGKRAFYRCSELSSVAFGEGLETVGEKAFEETAIQSLAFPLSTTLIDQQAFNNCRQLASLEVSSPACRIAEDAFDHCRNLSSVHIARGADVSMSAFGYPIADHTDDNRDVIWACDFNKGVVGEDIQSDCYANGHVVVSGDETQADIAIDKPSGRACALLDSSIGDGVSFSANKISGNRVGDAVAIRRGKLVTLSFQISSIGLCGPCGGAEDGSQGTMIGLDDKLVLRCCKDDGDDRGYVWQVTAGILDKHGKVIESTVALDSSDDSQELPDFTREWGEIRIQVIKHIPQHGPVYKIYFNRILAKAETGGTVFQARPSAENKTGVSALRISGAAAVDDIAFSLDDIGWLSDDAKNFDDYVSLEAASPVPERELAPQELRLAPDMRPFGGTWTNAEGEAILIVTSNNRCWLKQNGEWNFGETERIREDHLELFVEGKHVLFRPNPWMWEKLHDAGFAVDDEKWYVGDESVSQLLEYKSTSPDRGNAGKGKLTEVAKASVDYQQDDAWHCPETYVGIWHIADRVDVDRTTDGRYLSIRPDGSGGAFFMKDGCAVPGGGLQWTMEEEGIRCVSIGDDPRNATPSDDAYYMWFNTATEKMAVRRWSNWWIAKRADDVQDPLDTCRDMMLSRSYLGCWSGGEMFGAFSVCLEPDGSGFFQDSMYGTPVMWEADTNGNITITLPLPYGETTNAMMRYVPSTDTMYFPGDRAAPRKRDIHSQHPVKDITDQLKARFEQYRATRMQEMAKLKVNLEEETGNQHFEDLESLMVWLQGAKDDGEVSRHAAIETVSPHLSDTITCYSKGVWTVSLGTGYFERGMRPSQSEIESLVWQMVTHPDKLPQRQVENHAGLEELEKVCERHDKMTMKKNSFEKFTWWWHCCIDWVTVKFAEEDAKDVAEALQARLRGRFPCDAKVTITRRKIQ